MIDTRTLRIGPFTKPKLALIEMLAAKRIYLAYEDNNYTNIRYIIAVKTNGKINREYGKLLTL